MYIIKNAMRNIMRGKGRNILIMIIALVIAISACIALSIRQAAESTKKETLEGLSITANISVDRTTMMEQATDDGDNSRESMKSALQNMKELSIDELETYATADSVKDFYYSMSASVNGSSKLEAVDTSSSSSSDDSSTSDDSSNTFGEPGGGHSDRGGFGGMGTQGDFTLVGYSGESAMTNFIDGTCKITDGNMFTEGTTDKECVITDELATLNSLEVGDKIKLVNPNDEDEIIKFTIVGIYNNSESSVSSSGNMSGFGASNDPANQILTSYATLKAIVDKSEDGAITSTDDTTGMETSTAIRGQVTGTYTFANVDDYNNFDDEARELGLSDDYTVSSTDLQSYENSITPLENISKFATYFLIIVLIIGAIILVVLNMFNIRGRKYEIGVLTAIGMKKSKVALQFIMETFTVTFIAILLGAIIGSCTSVPVTNALLETQISSTQEQSSQIEENFGRGGSSDMPAGGPSDNSFTKGGFGGMVTQATDYIDSVNSATNMTVILQLLLLGLALTIVSSGAAIIFVMRYEPLKILTQRD